MEKHIHPFRIRKIQAQSIVRYKNKKRACTTNHQIIKSVHNNNKKQFQNTIIITFKLKFMLKSQLCECVCVCG